MLQAYLILLGNMGIIQKNIIFINSFLAYLTPYLSYCPQMSFKDIAKKEQINIRQIFRNFDKELSKFAYYLSQDGYDSSVT